MEAMTGEEREEFIRQRVQAILASHDEVHTALDLMTPAERDSYVHKRVEQDLLVSENLLSQLDALRENHRSAYLHITILDAVTISTVIALAIEVWNDLFLYKLVIPTFLMIIITFVISRFLNLRMNYRLNAIVELMKLHIGREQQTSALDYLVDLVEHDLAEKNK